jgi:hypothetical protein
MILACTSGNIQLERGLCHSRLWPGRGDVIEQRRHVHHPFIDLGGLRLVKKAGQFVHEYSAIPARFSTSMVLFSDEPRPDPRDVHDQKVVRIGQTAGSVKRHFVPPSENGHEHLDGELAYLAE